MVKYLFSIAIACSALAICKAQPPSNVNNFHFATWNSQGFRWSTIDIFMHIGNLDVLTVQEAGALPHESTDRRPPVGTLSSLNTFLPLCYIGYTPGDNDPALSVEEYIWTVNGRTYYIYYYDRRSRQDEVTGPRDPRADQNTAIVTRQRASRLFLMPVINRAGNLIDPSNPRFGVNRPVTGIQISNSVFFNLHAEPSNLRNEAIAVVNVIQNYMANNHPRLTWAVTGDFNRIPNFNLLPPPQTTFTTLLASGRITHPSQTGNTRSAELDYGFWGGPLVNYVQMQGIQFLTDYVNNRVQQHVPNPSDHFPVKFN